jgi:hypothetical protein
MLVVVEGLAYLVDVTAPDQGAALLREPVTQVVPVDEPPLLLLVDFSAITAIGVHGLAWQARRLCIDDLRVESPSEHEIVCSGSNLDGRDQDHPRSRNRRPNRRAPHGRRSGRQTHSRSR